MGPNISIKLINAGALETKVRSEFESVGINQTIHRIYLDVSCTVSILTPYSVVDETIQNEVLLIENVIVGLVPSTYYNLDGMDLSNAVDIIE
ncbi:MAG: sporulation protein YunB [Clostridia bacterium]|nr:sporulation protein YunB [Clostridia bacterium]